MAASSSSSKFVSVLKNHPIREEEAIQNSQPQQQQQSISISHQTSRTRKRRLPIIPREDVEVVALSPERLTADHWFECQECHRGFDREQNVQIHSRTHKLGGQLENRGLKEGPSRRKVYVCPEPGCIHNNPARALGDITGIKKHYARKHGGERRFSCQTCSRTYAVKADVKAHSKICRVKEERLKTFIESTVHASSSNISNENIEVAIGEISHFLKNSNTMIESEVPTSYSNISVPPASLSNFTSGTSSDELVHVSKLMGFDSLEKNNILSEGIRPTFSLHNFAPLNTNSVTFLGTNTHASLSKGSLNVHTSNACAEGNCSQQQTPTRAMSKGLKCCSTSLGITNSLNECIRPASSLNIFSPPITNSSTFISSIMQAPSLNDDTPSLSTEVFALTEDHPMMLSSTYSMIHPPHELPRSNGALTTMNSSIHKLGDATNKMNIFNRGFSHGFGVGSNRNNIFKEDMNGKSNTFSFSNLLLFGQLEENETRIKEDGEFGEKEGIGGGLNSIASNGHTESSNLYQYNGCNNSLNIFSSTALTSPNETSLGLSGNSFGMTPSIANPTSPLLTSYQSLSCIPNIKSSTPIPAPPAYGEANQHNYIQQCGNLSTGGEGSSSATTLFGVDVTIGRNKVIGKTNDFLKFKKSVHENH